MKKFFLAFVLFSFGIQFNSFASGRSDLFDLDVEDFKSEFIELESIEKIILDHEGVSIDGLQNVLGEEHLSIELMETVSTLELNEPPLGIPSFVWGCVFGITGLAVVYFVADDTEETKRALYGCVTNGVVGGLFYILYIALIVASTATA